MTYVQDTPRDAVARALSAYYRELQPPEQKQLFSVSTLLNRMATPGPTFGSTKSYEDELVSAHATAHGLDYDPFRPVVPWRALSRALTDQPGSAGGYGVNGAGPHGELATMLTPYSIFAEAGATILDVDGTGPVQLPVHKTAASGTWLGPGVTISPSTAPLGVLSLVPKTYITVLDYSVQLDRQAGPLRDRLITTAMLQTAGTGMDSGTISGAGGVELLGIINRADIATTSGTSLGLAGIAAMRKSVLNGGARESNLRWIGAPDVEEILSKREQATGSGFIWEDGNIVGIPAIASSRVPNGILVLADWSQLYVAIWSGGLGIDVNPHANFNAGIAAARIVLMVDCGFAQAGAVTYAKNIT